MLQITDVPGHIRKPSDLRSVTALPLVTLGQVRAEHGNFDSNISSSQDPQAIQQLKELVPAPGVAGLTEPAPQPGVGGDLLWEQIQLQNRLRCVRSRSCLFSC